MKWLWGAVKWLLRSSLIYKRSLYKLKNLSLRYLQLVRVVIGGVEGTVVVAVGVRVVASVVVAVVMEVVVNVVGIVGMVVCSIQLSGLATRPLSKPTNNITAGPPSRPPITTGVDNSNAVFLIAIILVL